MPEHDHIIVLLEKLHKVEVCQICGLTKLEIEQAKTIKWLRGLLQFALRAGRKYQDKHKRNVRSLELIETIAGLTNGVYR